MKDKGCDAMGTEMEGQRYVGESKRHIYASSLSSLSGLVLKLGDTGVPETCLSLVEESALRTTDQRLFPLMRDSPSSRWISALLLSRRASI